MFDNKVIVENSLTRVTSAEAGFDGVSVLARLPYYRGLGLSMVENIAVTVDDKVVAREDTLFSVRGNTWTLDEMETEYGDRWNFGEKAKVLVKLPEGLVPSPCGFLTCRSCLPPKIQNVWRCRVNPATARPNCTGV